MPARNNNIVDIKDIKRVIRALRDNWWVFIFSVLLALGLAYTYSYKLPRIYASKMQLFLKNEQTYSYQEGLFRGLGMSDNSYERIANEQKILSSNDLLAQTIAKLKMDVSYFIVGKIITKEVFIGTPFSVEATIYNGNYYEAPFTFKILDLNTYQITYVDNEKEVEVTHKFGEPLITNNFYLLINLQRGMSNETLNSLKEITYQFAVHNRENLMYKFKSAMQIQNLEYTAILEVTLEDENSERTVAFLDTLAHVYLNNSFKTRLRVNENTLGFIDRQLGEVVGIIDSIEVILENFKASKDIINLPREEESYYSYYVKYDGQRRALELQLKTIEYLKKYITSNLNKELLPPSIYIESEDKDSYLTTAINQLYNLQVQINNALFSSTSNSTTIKEIEYRIELLRSDILKYLLSTEQAIHQKSESVQGEIDYYEGMMKGIPQNQKHILNISRKLEANEKMYVYLLEKRAETVIAKAGIVSDMSIVETAHPVGVVKPDLQKIYYTFASFGLLIALIIAFVRSIFFSKIENMDELRDLTQYPILGEIIHSKDVHGSYVLSDEQIKSTVAESFRALRTNLEYFSTEVKNKVVLITSNLPSAGKTFCSINLGTLLAKGGKKVLIMEMDLHKPKINIAFGFQMQEGMSNLLIGKASFREIIRSTEVENLDVVLAGPIPPNASELILSPHVNEFIEYAKSQYDYILVDTPPIGIISDALVLMKYSDINLFILNSSKGSKEALDFVHRTLATNPVKGFAFVLNNVRQKGLKYYYRNYGYGYSYGGENE